MNLKSNQFYNEIFNSESSQKVWENWRLNNFWKYVNEMEEDLFERVIERRV